MKMLEKHDRGGARKTIKLMREEVASANPGAVLPVSRISYSEGAAADRPA
jgi:hypothetical protein